MTFTVTQTNKDEVLKQIETATTDFRNKVASFGYECRRPFWRDGSLELSFSKGNNRYLPEIYFDIWHFCKTKKMRWELNMGAFGSVSGEELQQWFNSQKAGMELIHFLEAQNLKDILPEIVFA